MEKPCLFWTVCYSIFTFLSFFFVYFLNNLCNLPLQALNWVFVVDTMNFSFWPEEETQQCEVTYKGTTYTGYMTLCAAITRAMEEGKSTYLYIHLVTILYRLIENSSRQLTALSILR